MNQDMLNGSRYVDMTAYLAIKKVEREEKKMTENSYVAGDIVNVQTARGEDTVLIVKCNEAYATTLKLLDNAPDENCISITARTKMYADCGRFSYAYYDKIVDLVRTMKDDEFDKVRRKIVETLCLEEAAEGGMLSVEAVREDNTVKLPEFVDFCEQIGRKIDVVTGQLTVTQDPKEHEELIKTKAELTLMKQLYAALLDRMA